MLGFWRPLFKIKRLWWVVLGVSLLVSTVLARLIVNKSILEVRKEEDQQLGLSRIPSLNVIQNVTAGNALQETSNWKSSNVSEVRHDTNKMNGVLLRNGYVDLHNASKNLQLHCSECAVVSNSGQLIGRNAGPEIDRSDCVIRMNDAPTLGFEADVGTRTTLRIISFATINSFNPKKLFNSSNSADTVVFWSPKQFMLTNGSGWVFNTLSTYKKNFSNVQFYINKPEKLEADHELYLKETRRHIGPIWATTGWFTMVFAMEVCDSISVYGMSQPEFCRTHPRDMTPYHYYNPRGQKECRQYRYHEKMNRNTHKYLLERDVFIRWSEWKTITFRHPTW